MKKVTGDYDFDGIVDAVFTKQDGKRRIVVEDDRGALHIFSEQNLAPIGNTADHQYLKVLDKLLRYGVHREGRNGRTYSLFGEQLRFDLQEGFPLLTTKNVHFKSILVELLWFIRGDTNVRYLQDHGVTIWDEWADENGDLGPVYGKQWRSWQRPGLASEPIDQLVDLIDGLKRDPHSRRHIITAWNPAEIKDMALPPCHCFMQFHVANGRLSCQLFQRSADWFLGVPFNIASYALLTMLIARETDLIPAEFIHTFGDLHLYANHVEQAKQQLLREPRELPIVLLDAATELSMFKLEPRHFALRDYDPHPSIRAEVSA